MLVLLFFGEINEWLTPLGGAASTIRTILFSPLTEPPSTLVWNYPRRDKNVVLMPPSTHFWPNCCVLHDFNHGVSIPNL